MIWYKLHIPRNEIVSPKFYSIHRLYSDLMLAFPYPMENTVLLSTLNNFDNFHYYFCLEKKNDVLLPLLQDILNCIECEKPQKSDVGFNAGNYEIYNSLK